MKKILLLALTLLMSLEVYAFNCADKGLEGLAVQERGRIKPYLVMAQEEVKLVTGESSIDGKSALEVFCLWTKESLGVKANFDTYIRVEHVKVKEFLGMNENDLGIEASKLSEKRMDLRSEIMSIKESNSYKKELEKVLTRLMTLDSIQAGTLWTVPVIIEGEPVWHAFSDLFKTDSDEVLTKLFDYEAKYSKAVHDDHALELIYAKTHPFSIALLMSLLAIFAVVLFKDLKYGRFIAILSILVQTVGMIMRVHISGRAPITNMYETVMFSGFGALIIAVVITFLNKEKLFLLGGLAYSILCLFMMMFAHTMLDSSISPLVPVLRDNFWLSTHVSTIILSYGALALSWMIANIVLFKVRFTSITSKDYRYYESLIYTSIKVGVVLLAAGIILGGVWADYSWGRFWGWDPKETWSLIVLLIYMAILHGKSTTWVNTHRFVVLSAGAFMTVMMAWFGVNYILATGLHSYGFSEGGAFFLGSFFFLQTVFLFVAGVHPKFSNIKA